MLPFFPQLNSTRIRIPDYMSANTIWRKIHAVKWADFAGSGRIRFGFACCHKIGVLDGLQYFYLAPEEIVLCSSVYANLFYDSRPSNFPKIWDKIWVGSSFGSSERFSPGIALLLRTEMCVLKANKMSPLFQEVIVASFGAQFKKWVPHYQMKDMDIIFPLHFFLMILCRSIS